MRYRELMSSGMSSRILRTRTGIFDIKASRLNVSRQPARAYCNPSDTDYYQLDPTSDNVLGQPRIESTRLQAAARRIAEQFMVYDAIDQVLLEQEAQLDFGPPKEVVSELVEVDIEELQKLGRSDLVDARHYLFNSFQLENSKELLGFVEEIERMPRQAPLPPGKMRAKLRSLLQGSETNVLGEIAALLAAGVPKLASLHLLMRQLVEKGYYKPAQVVLDSLIMSRTTLNASTLAFALELARYAGDYRLFDSYARLLDLPIPTEKMSCVEKYSETGSVYPSLLRRFDLQTEITHPSGDELAFALAKGAAKFEDPQLLDRAFNWAVQTKTLSSRLLQANFRAAKQFNDPKRAAYTWEKLQEYCKNDIPRALQSKLISREVLVAAAAAGIEDARVERRDPADSRHAPKGPKGPK